jgi:hypothetical protein
MNTSSEEEMAPVVAAGPSGGTLAEVEAAEGGQEMRRPCKRQRCEEEGEEEGEEGEEGKGEALRAARLASVVIEGTRLCTIFLPSRLLDRVPRLVNLSEIRGDSDG